MLWFLKQDNGNVYYITGNIEHAIGRGECHLTLPSDQSVSRRHASVWVENGVVKIKDLGSRYGTFINEGIEQNRIISNTGEVYTLSMGDKIRFGMQWNVWQLTGISIRTVASNVTSEQKELILSYLAVLNGQLLMDFDDTCTHVTVDTIYLTVKFLCGLVKGLPIVTSQYWKDCVDCVRANRLLPDVKNYIPPVGEDVLNKENLNLSPTARRQLFRGKFFLFSNERTRSKLHKLIELAGGQSGLWSSCEKLAMIQPNVIVLYPSLGVGDPSQEYPGFKEIAALLEANGKRMVPEYEIAVAVWHCDCSTNCNPNFKVTPNVFRQMNMIERNDEILVVETQNMSQYSNYGNPDASQMMVNQTVISPTQSTVAGSQNVVNQAGNIPTENVDPSMLRKRLVDSEDMFGVPADKRPRLEEPNNQIPAAANSFHDPMKTNNCMAQPPTTTEVTFSNNVAMKRKADETDGPMAKRYMPDHSKSETKYNVTLVDPSIIENIYAPSGWLSKSFLKMEIKEEIDGENPPDEDKKYVGELKQMQVKLMPSIMVRNPLYVAPTKTEGEESTVNDTTAVTVKNCKKFRKAPVKKANYIIQSFTRKVCDGKLSSNNKIFENESNMDSLENNLVRCS